MKIFCKTITELKKTSKRIHTYALQTIRVLGYFWGIIESGKKTTESKIFVADKKNAGNIIGVASSRNLSYIKLNRLIL